MPAESAEVTTVSESPGELLAEAGARAITALVEGDRWLRRLSLLHAEWPWSSLYFAPRMHIRLNIFGEWRRNRVRFILLKVGQTRRAADIRLGFQLRPSPDRRDMGSRWLKPVYVPPACLQNPGEAGRLLLRLDSGRLLDIRFSAAGITASMQGVQLLLTIGQWPWDWVMELLQTLAQDAPGSQEREVAFTLLDSDAPGEVDSMGYFLRLCFAQYDALWEQLASKSADTDPLFQAWEPPAYVIDRLDARIRAWIGRNGRIMSHAGDAGGTEIAIDVEVDTGSQGPRARFSTGPATARLPQSHRRHALDAMHRRAEDLIEATQLAAAMGIERQLPGEEESEAPVAQLVADFRTLLRDPQLKAAFYRLNAANLELVILEGVFRNRRGMLAMTLPFIPADAAVSLSDDRSQMQLLASTLRGTRAASSIPRFRLGKCPALQTHIENSLRQLEAWQRRMESAA